ncbi:MAG: hypothetical protein AAF799_12805 [Myxococcota bacterium]
MLASGCIVPVSVGDVEDDGQGSEGGTTSGMPGSDGPDGATSMFPGGSTSTSTATGDPGDGTTSGGTVGDGGTDTGSDTGTDTGGGTMGDGASVCDPQPQDISAQFHLADDEGKFLEPIFIQWDQQCEVVAITLAGLGQSFDLLCESAESEGPEQVQIVTPDVQLDLPVEIGQMVRYRGLYDVSIDTPSERYVAVSNLEGELLVGLQQRRKAEYEAEVADFFAPLDIQLATGVCEPEPYMMPTEEGSTFIFDPCGEEIERHAIDVTVGAAAPQRVFDKHRQTVEGYDIWVDQAITADPQEDICFENFPTTRTRLIMVAIP